MNETKTIYTYGRSNLRKEDRPKVDAEFDASSWIKKFPMKQGKKHKQGKIDLTKVNGTMRELQDSFLEIKQFTEFVEFVYTKMVKHGYKKVAIFCTQGRHRSVAVAEIVARRFISPKIIHMNLKMLST